jgi:hypothetical protein
MSAADSPYIRSPGAGPPPTTDVARAIQGAARHTSVGFDFLLAKARVESSLNPAAAAPTSSARGLFQFIESTWLATMKRHGARFGLEHLAADISTSPSGRPFVADPDRRREILDLRFNPDVAALMAAGLAEDNHAAIRPVLGREPTHAELYLAHFLGPGGATAFLRQLEHEPQQSAPALFPRAAAANRSIFFGERGAERSLTEVMKILAAKLEKAGAGSPSAWPADAPPSFNLAQADSRTRSDPLFAGSASRFGQRPAPAGPSVPALPVRMSDLLAETFGAGGTASPAHVRHTYERLRAAGL